MIGGVYLTLSFRRMDVKDGLGRGIYLDEDTDLEKYSSS